MLTVCEAFIRTHSYIIALIFMAVFVAFFLHICSINVSLKKRVCVIYLVGNIVNNPKQSVAVKQMFLTRFIAVKPANAFCIYTVCVVIAETDGIFLVLLRVCLLNLVTVC